MSYPVFHKLVEQELGIRLTPEYRFAPPRRWRFDFACPEKMIAIEVEGGVWMRNPGRHNRGSGFVKDMEKYNTAAAMGWRVLRFTPEQLLTDKTLNIIKQAI